MPAMKRPVLFFVIFCLLFLLSAVPSYSQGVPAFPGAEGCGMYTTGGRGGRIYFVTNLNDTGVGSLRWAIKQSGPRVIVFKVSGIIALQSALSITTGDVTIAGQTAPGDGICIKNYALTVAADNVIIRYIRCRLGDEKRIESDAFSGRDHQNILIDHCSISWSVDECSSFYDNVNTTVQWSIVSESLQNSVHSKGAHSAGGIWGGQKASFHHNFLSDHYTRNPRFSGSRNTNAATAEKVDFRNNVIYNWIDNSGYGGEGGSFNIINNYYKYGPGTETAVKSRIFQPWGDDGTLSQTKSVYGKYYVNGNYVYGNSTVSADNWAGMEPDYTNLPFTVKDSLVSNTEFSLTPVSTHTAELAFERVLEYVGASLSRDTIDRRLVREARNGNCTYTGSVSNVPGLIDSQANVGGWPVYATFGTVPTDTDGDGIPDDWELKNNLDPDNVSDGLALAEGKGGYTNLDIYLASLVDSITEAQVAGAVTVPVILFTQPSNGTISVRSGETSVSCGAVTYGTELTITATPDDDYILASLQVNGTDFMNGGIYIANSDVTIVATMRLASSLNGVSIGSDFVIGSSLVSDVLNLTYTTPGDIQIQVYNAMGTLVKSCRSNDSSIKMCVSDLAPGVYILQSTQNQIILNKRFVKK
jgi:hypothetical protein